VDRPRPNASVVRMLLQAYPQAARVRDTTGNLPLNISLDHGAVKSVEVVKMLLDSYPDSAKEPNSTGRLPLHSVLNSPNPDVGVARYLAKQYPPAITLESKEGTLHVCWWQWKCKCIIYCFVLLSGGNNS
jgi:hypothetical protein